MSEAAVLDDSTNNRLPPHVRRFAPWTWSPMELLGVGLTLATACTAAWLLALYFLNWR